MDKSIRSNDGRTTMQRGTSAQCRNHILNIGLENAEASEHWPENADQVARSIKLSTCLATTILSFHYNLQGNLIMNFG